jgi:hypothetical protein
MSLLLILTTSVLNKMSASSCPGDSSHCQQHFHDEDPKYLHNTSHGSLADPEAARTSTSAILESNKEEREATPLQQATFDKRDVGFRRIIRNFTPS